MRIPKIENYKNDSVIVTKELPALSDLERDSEIFINDKARTKFIKTVERIVRSSKEYRDYIKYLKDNIDMTYCTYFPKITTKNRGRVSIEIHHEPFTLYDITDIVLNKFIDEDLGLNPLMVAEEVMKIHYRGLVGLVPLSSTVHGLVTDGKIFIPLQNVYGNFPKFVDEYENYMSEDLRSILKEKIKLSKDLSSNDTSILQTKFVYLKVDGMTLPQIVN